MAIAIPKENIMKKQYAVIAGNAGAFLADNHTVYDSKTAAIWGMKHELEGWANAWQFTYDYDKNKVIRNPYWKVSGSASSGLYYVKIAKYHVISIEMCDISYQLEDTNDTDV